MHAGGQRKQGSRNAAATRLDTWFLRCVAPGGPYDLNRKVDAGEVTGYSRMTAIGHAHSSLAHPYPPGERPGIRIGDRATRSLEGELDLSVVVAFVPEHVLEEEHRVVVVKFHGPGLFRPALHRIAHGAGAVDQHLRETVGVALVAPFGPGQGLRRESLRELGSVFSDEYQAHVVDVGEELSDGRAVRQRPGLQSAGGESTEQIDQDGVVPIPGIEESVEELSKCAYGTRR